MEHVAPLAHPLYAHPRGQDWSTPVRWRIPRTPIAATKIGARGSAVASAARPSPRPRLEHVSPLAHPPHAHRCGHDGSTRDTSPSPSSARRSSPRLVASSRKRTRRSTRPARRAHQYLVRSVRLHSPPWQGWRQQDAHVAGAAWCREVGASPSRSVERATALMTSWRRSVTSSWR